ncbi:MAG: ATP-binding protein [Candidatus Riflebacteria bacterium]|nr:ATP-binding protein [Candidatus Riflebacteria bacterium]
MAADIKSLIPKEPEQLIDLKIDSEIITNLILKELYIHGRKTPRQLGKTLRLRQDIVQKLINELKQQEMVGMVGGSGMGTDYQYGLYPKGIERSKQILESDAYVGAAPVGFEEYIRICKAALDFNKKNFGVNQRILQEKFSKYLGFKDILMQIGQAVCARKPAFVYGFPGNGKTFLCGSVVKLLPPMIVPYAVEVANQLVRIYDPSCHVAIENVELEGLDQRWVLIQPPLIVAGGELTLEALEVVYNKKFGCFDAPPQVKSNGGVLLIDDLGRQRCSVEEIFNRFIIPLENKVDFMVLGGQRMEVPTDAIILFSTNLDPQKIVDDAFLRRLPYKINVRNPTTDEYIDIWRVGAEKLGMKYTQETMDFLWGLYKRDKRGLRSVHPRDLLNIIFENKRFLEDEDTNIRNSEVEGAYKIYFVSQLTLIETNL